MDKLLGQQIHKELDNERIRKRWFLWAQRQALPFVPENLAEIVTRMDKLARRLMKARPLWLERNRVDVKGEMD